MPMEGLGEALYQKAYQKGLGIGEMLSLDALIRAGHITEEAAKAKGITVEDFRKKMNEILVHK